MKSHDIFSAVDPAVVTEMLDWFRANDRNVYKTAVATLAAGASSAPFSSRKNPSRNQRTGSYHKTLQIRACDPIGEQILQLYLMAGQQSMLGMFCDGMGIAHDGKVKVRR